MTAELEGDALVTVSNADVSLGERQVLDGVDFEVYQREIVSLIGPNGSGKTTLLRVALGILRPDRGRVWRRPGLAIGYMPQRVIIERTLPLTASRFVRLSGSLSRSGATELLREVGAGGLADRPVQALSGGEFQRVLLARALARSPDLLFLDEPAQGVDAAGQVDLYRLIAKIRDDHDCGVVVISHDIHMVMSGTDRVVCLNRHICCSGRPGEVREHPEYQALFGLRPADGLAPYEHDHDHAHRLSGAAVPDVDPQKIAGGG